MRPPVLCLVVALLLLAHPDASGAVVLQPHRAIYRMVLSNAAQGSDVVSANGVMIYRFARGCDGWTVENQTFLRMLYDNDSQVDTLWSFVSWESTDGRKFRFHARYDQDGKNVEKLEGQAELKTVGGAGHARFSHPEKEMPLPSGTVFPTEHVRRIIAAAEQGKHRLNRVVFDGASLDNPYVVNAVFGPLPPPAAEALANGIGVPVMPAWWTRIAFFPFATADEVPEFEMAAHYRSDGIADKIIQYFETFALDVRIKEVELLPAPDC